MNKVRVGSAKGFNAADSKTTPARMSDVRYLTIAFDQVGTVLPSGSHDRLRTKLNLFSQARLLGSPPTSAKEKSAQYSMPCILFSVVRNASNPSVW